MLLSIHSGALESVSYTHLETAAEMTATLGEKAKESLMPFLMTNSLPAAAFFIRLTLVCLVSFLAAVLSLQEMEELRHRRDQSLFRREFNLIGSRLVQTGKAWFKSQGIIQMCIRDRYRYTLRKQWGFP